VIGLADMAMTLAENRVVVSEGPWVAGFWTRLKIPPCDRNELNPVIHPVSAEYYAIIDRISRGEAP
jgi:hypothetical protein